MKIRVLGSAAGGGLPQWNCGCERCVRARAGDPAVPPRTQPSIAVSADGVRWSIVSASPDVRDQLARFPALHPRPGTRDIPLDTILLTNADVDHVLGLLVLRESLPYRIVSTPFVRNALLDHNALLQLLEPAWGIAKLDQPVMLDRDGHLEARVERTRDDGRRAHHRSVQQAASRCRRSRSCAAASSTSTSTTPPRSSTRTRPRRRWCSARASRSRWTGWNSTSRRGVGARSARAHSPRRSQARRQTLRAQR
jgi:coenzyme PQQ biosynthesis protein B